jgi:hypothetical protein
MNWTEFATNIGDHGCRCFGGFLHCVGQYFKVAFGPEYLASWGLFALGIVAAKVAWNTLQRIAEQSASGKTSADAAEKAANAALASAQSQMAAERAWLIILPKMEAFQPRQTDSNPTFYWQIKNVGNTPGRLIETQAIYERVRSDQLIDLPESPTYPPPIKLNGLLLAPNDSLPFSTFLKSNDKIVPNLNQQECLNINNGTLHLRAYGYVKYLDTSGVLRESRFCHSYVFRGTGKLPSGFSWLFYAPSAYIQNT